MKKRVVDNDYDFSVSDVSTEKVAIVEIGQLDEYKGSLWFSYRGVLFFAVVVLMIGPLMGSVKVVSWFGFFALLVFLPLWFLLNSQLMHYFAMSSQYLVVRSHLAFWRREMYRLSDVEEVVIESHGRAPHSMRVITKDFKNKKYYGGTLSTKTWRELVKRLSKTSIRVRNEIDL